MKIDNQSLRTLAPGFHKDLGRVFDPQQQEKLQKYFDLAVSNGALYELASRKQHDSFNPKPARLGYILLKYFNKLDCNILCCAFLFCCQNRDSFGLASENEISNLLNILSSTKNFYADDLPVAVKAILLANSIDDVRHIHMSALQPEAKDIIIKSARSIMTICTEPELTRLHAILDKATSRQKTQPASFEPS